MVKYVLDKPVKKIYGLNQMKIGETLCGIPTASHYINKKGHHFLLLKLDYGHAICNIYFLIFDYPLQNILNSKYTNSFELVKFYRNVTGEGIDEGINQVHDINWSDIIDWLNSLQVLKIQVTSKNLNGFKNIRFVSFTKERLYDNIEKCNWKID